MPKILINHDFNIIAGVYQIKFDGLHIYIGSSTNLQNRIWTWKNDINKGWVAHNKKVSKMISASTNVEIDVLEICPPSQCKIREDFYIKQHVDSEHLLNLSLSAFGTILRQTEEQIVKNKQFGIERRIKAPLLKPISITRTQGEWDIILYKISEMGKKDLSVFIRGEIFKLKNKHRDHPTKIPVAKGMRIEKRPYIPIEALDELTRVSIQMQMPIGAVINNLIISPLLQP